MGIRKVTKAELLKSGRVERVQVETASATARRFPGSEIDLGHTRGGARIQVVSTKRGAVRYWLSGYAADGSDLSLAVLP